jgi:transcriptional regulator with XRE-family HTH domain
MTKNMDKNSNRFLWQARQRSNLSQKTVAFLLGRKFTDEVSRYESGQRLPTLPTALKLEIIYRVPVRLLFYETFVSSQWQIRERGSRYKELFPRENLCKNNLLEEQLGQDEYCTYAELLKTPNLPPVEKLRIHGHIKHLMNTLNGIKDIQN